MISRIRTVKPEFFQHSSLFDAEKETCLPIRLAFAGLWTCCDREGRFKWRPRELKIRVLPYDEVDFSHVLDALWTRGFIVKYTVNGEDFGCIPSWHRHQVINNRESQSQIPAQAQNQSIEQVDASSTRDTREKDASATPLVHALAEGKGKEGNGTGKEGKSVSAAATATPEPVAVITLPLNSGDEYPITADAVKEFTSLYPAIDVLQELRNMRGWLLANERNRKTQSGVMRFIASWLSKEQNRAPVRTPHEPLKAKPPTAAVAYQIPPGLDNEAGEKIWSHAKKSLSNTINTHSFETWLKPVKAVGLRDGVLFVTIPSKEFSHVQSKFGSLISEALSGLHIEHIEYLSPEETC